MMNHEEYVAASMSHVPEQEQERSCMSSGLATLMPSCTLRRTRRLGPWKRI